jgi:hypothetical protein
MQAVWTQKTGSPPKGYDGYDALTLLSLLNYADPPDSELSSSEATIETKHKPWGPPTLAGGKKLDYDEPQTTGDPLVDYWETQVAAGGVPDW